ncbi:protein of unknown function [Nitrospira defluvii]|uniref:Uncharacterized protein n=1 Tax=Nitrospira defluvii TaxID=330214 RepID=D8PC57_9BACT|nr:protein of unknown function [Nitrospira defluvii]
MTCLTFRPVQDRKAQVKQGDLQAGNGVGQVFSAEGLEPLTRDRIAFFHGHAGVFTKHLRAPSSSPREKTEKVILADRMGACRRIDSRLTSVD